jgi:hypothetical protein
MSTMWAALNGVVKDTFILAIVADALLPGQNKPLWPITWEQLNPLHDRVIEGLPDDNNTEINPEERLLLLLSVLVTASNFDQKTWQLPDWLIAHPLTYDTCPTPLYKGNSLKPSLATEESKNVAVNGSSTDSGKANNGAGIIGYFFFQPATQQGYLVFTGTSDDCMSMIDMDYPQVLYDKLANYRPDTGGHRGFYQAYLAIREQLQGILKQYYYEDPVNPDAAKGQPSIVICGHSLGGALSTIAAFDLAAMKPIHYAFAAPRVFNIAGAQNFNELGISSYRISNTADIVVTVPMAIMGNGSCYDYVGHSREFQCNMGNYSDNHGGAYLLRYQLLQRRV